MGGQVGLQEEVILSLEKLNKIVHIDTVASVVTLEAGMIIIIWMTLYILFKVISLPVATFLYLSLSHLCNFLYVRLHSRGSE